MMSKTIDDTARELAEAHRTEDPDTTDIFLSPDPAGQEVRLVEVSGSVGTANEVLPFRFGPAPEYGVPFASVVILLSRAEWEAVRAGTLRLPEGWESPAQLRKIA